MKHIRSIVFEETTMEKRGKILFRLYRVKKKKTNYCCLWRFFLLYCFCTVRVLSLILATICLYDWIENGQVKRILLIRWRCRRKRTLEWWTWIQQHFLVIHRIAYDLRSNTYSWGSAECLTSKIAVPTKIKFIIFQSKSNHFFTNFTSFQAKEQRITNKCNDGRKSVWIVSISEWPLRG